MLIHYTIRIDYRRLKTSAQISRLHCVQLEILKGVSIVAVLEFAKCLPNMTEQEIATTATQNSN